MLKRAMVILTSLAAITGGAVMVAPAASAAGFGCAGSQIDVYPVTDADNGAVLSDIFLYYDASTGKNCASNVRTSAGGAGTAARISVSVWADGGSAVTDNGIYSQYAGAGLRPGCRKVHQREGDHLRVRRSPRVGAAQRALWLNRTGHRNDGGSGSGAVSGRESDAALPSFPHSGIPFVRHFVIPGESVLGVLNIRAVQAMTSVPCRPM
ncbi:hypothetical protein OG322_16620 [Streptomyces sp. NBC_01260]|uniref:hypothetical protein n=1 Tax=Streptomyces sp. NBC_01260 TaxID=2903801 RepID=UPI002E338C22|nr:hypothetical protein [Streptomyces sp. NBC_01260]